MLFLDVPWSKLLRQEAQDGGLPKQKRYGLCPFPNRRADEAEGFVIISVYEETLQGPGAETEDRVLQLEWTKMETGQSGLTSTISKCNVYYT